MADEENEGGPAGGKAQAAAAGAAFTTESQKSTAQRGGPQEDQLAGETDKGAHNQAEENRNPSGGEPDGNQQARQEGGPV